MFLNIIDDKPGSKKIRFYFGFIGKKCSLTVPVIFKSPFAMIHLEIAGYLLKIEVL